MKLVKKYLKTIKFDCDEDVIIKHLGKRVRCNKEQGYLVGYKKGSLIVLFDRKSMRWSRSTHEKYFFVDYINGEKVEYGWLVDEVEVID